MNENKVLFDQELSEKEIDDKINETKQKRYKRNLRKNQSVKSIVQALDYDTTYIKLKHCFEFLKHAGFESLVDDRRIEINWNGLIEYCKKNEEAIRVLWNCKKMFWKKEIDDNERNKLMKYIQPKLNTMLAIGFEKINIYSLLYKLIYKFEL